MEKAKKRKIKIKCGLSLLFGMRRGLENKGNKNKMGNVPLVSQRF